MRISKLIAVFLILVVIPLFGIRCRKGVSQEVAQANRPVTLKWWRVFDDQNTVQPAIEAYRAIHPNVTIEYRKLRFEDYERELLNALAEDRGPDIVSIHNTWMRAYEPKLAPLPPSITLPYPEVTGGLKKEVVITLKTNPTLSTRGFKTSFVDAVINDALITSLDPKGQVREQIFGLPLAIDTLTLFANRDLLNLAGVPEVPKTWSEFQTVIKKLTKLDDKGNLIQSGAALGSSRNIERATDILSLLMMQNMAEMLDSSGSAAFQKVPRALEGRASAPGEEALVFYTDFANPQKEVYTWSPDFPSSLEAFVTGRTAFFFGYSYHLPLIRARAPRLNLEVAKVPQIEGNPEVNFANYWIEGVSRKSQNQDWAWDFIQFVANSQNVPNYLQATGKPAALRGLLAGQSEKEYIGIFASQALTARSWYKGANARAAEASFLDAIDSILSGAETRDVLLITAQRVNQTLR